MLYKLLWIALAGALGTLARYGLSGAVHAFFGRDFPWGTMSVNMAGSLLFGFLWAYSSGRLPITSEVRTIILVGFMGAFTTFSTLVFETGMLLEEARWALAMGNLALQNVVGLGALFLGLAVGRLV